MSGLVYTEVDGWTIGRRAGYVEARGPNGALLFRSGNDLHLSAENNTRVPASVLAALSAPPPDAEIERLVDALDDAAYGAGWDARDAVPDDGGPPYPTDDDKVRARNAAHDALLAAISRRVPGDLAGLRTVVEVALRVWSRHAEDAEEWGVIADLRAALGATCVCWPGFVAGGIVHADSCPARPRACDLANLAPPAPAEES